MPRRIQLAHHLAVLLLELEAFYLLRHLNQPLQFIIPNESVVCLAIVGRRRWTLRQVGLLVGVDFGGPCSEPRTVDLQDRRGRIGVKKRINKRQEDQEGAHGNWTASRALLLHASRFNHQPVMNEADVDPLLPALLNQSDVPLKFVDLIREVAEDCVSREGRREDEVEQLGREGLART